MTPGLGLVHHGLLDIREMKLGVGRIGQGARNHQEIKQRGHISGHLDSQEIGLFGLKQDL
jgi:hypothetical protein